MSRTILSTNDLGPTPAEFQAGGSGRARPKRADAYVDRLLKLIPAEIVAVWVTMRGTLAAAGDAPIWLQWVAFLVLLALTPIYLRRTAGITKPAQVWISTGALAVWVFSLGGAPFDTLAAPYFLPIYGAILLPLYTFAAPLMSVDP